MFPHFDAAGLLRIRGNEPYAVRAGQARAAALVNGFAGSAGAAQDQLFQIQEMLRLKLLPGPAAGWLQLDAHEIADLPVDAVAHNAGQIIAGTVYIYMRAYGHGYLEL